MITNTAAPSVSGPSSPDVDDTLTTSIGSWQYCLYPITHYYYQWLRNGSAISGATGSSYTVGVADVGATVKSEVEACDDYGDCSGFVQSSNSRVPISQPPNVPSGLSPSNYQEFDSTPTLKAVFSDPDPSESGYVDYSVYRQSDNKLMGQGGGPVVSSGTPSNWTPPTLAGEQWYYWDAQAVDSSQSSALSAAQYFYVNTPASVPQLQLPASSSTLFTTTPVLSATATDAETIYFQFQVATDAGFSNIVADSGWVTGTGSNGSWAVTAGALQRNRTYYWRARAEDIYAAEGDPNDPPSNWSATNGFTVSVSGLGANGSWPMWSHGPLSANEANGNLVLSLPTPSYPTATGSLTFSLTYNSQAPAGNSSGGLGQGWTLAGGDGSMSPPLQLVDHANCATPCPRYDAAEIDWPDGSSDSYAQVGTAGSGTANTYLPSSGDGSQLTHNPDGSWTLLDSDGTSYTFGQETSGVSYLTGAETPATSTGHGILSYTFDPTSHEITQLAYQDTTSSPASEELNFSWASTCTINNVNISALICVTGPDGKKWAYTANSSSQITGVYDSLPRQLLSLGYGSNGLISSIKDANDLDPTHASPGYSNQHSIQLTYDASSPARVSCVIDGPISDQAASPQPSCAGGSPASESTWSFSYHPGAVEAAPPQASHYGYLVRNAAPAAYYPLDETSGSSAGDASGNGNNASYSGSYTLGQRPGALAGSGGGTAVAFSGGTVSGSIANLDLAPGGYNTVEMWVNWNGTNNEMPFSFGSLGVYDLWFSNGYFGFNSGNGDLYGTTAPTANTWHYIVAEFYNGVLSGSKLWIDGVQEPIAQVLGTSSPDTAAASFNISGDYANVYQFTGQIDEVAVYGYALSQVQIASHFAEGVHHPAPIAYYRLDDTNTTTAADSSGNGNNATYSGSYTQGQTGVGGANGWSGSAVGFSGGTVSGSAPTLNTSAGGYNTVSFWLNWDGGQGEIPFSFGGYALFFNWNEFGFWNSGGDIFMTSNVPSANTWHYVVAEFYNGQPESGAKLWIDGAPQSLSETGTAASSTASTTFNISGWSLNGNWRLPAGAIDEVQIYNTALTPAEITNDYNTNAPQGNPLVGTGQGAAAGYTTLTPPNQQGPGHTCPPSCATTFYDNQSNTLETIDPLGRSSESDYSAQNQLLWSEDAAGNPTDYLYGGPNGQPSGNPAVTEVLLQTIQPDPDGSGPMTRPVTTSRYDEEKIGSASSAGTPLAGLAASYWAGTTSLAGQPSVRENDPAPGSSASTFSLPFPGTGWPVSGNSSARWSGDITIPSAGDYTFSTVSDGGTRLTIDGTDAINNWTIPGSSPFTASSQAIHLSAGLHQLVLDYEHAGSTSQTLALDWQCTDCSQPINTATAVPLANLAPAWLNQTSTLTPAGRLSYSHYAHPELGEPDYTLVQVNGSNLITSLTYDPYGRLTGQVMPEGNLSANIDSYGNLSGAGDPTSSNYGSTNTYYGDNDGDGDTSSDTDSDGETSTAAPPATCGGGSAINQYDQLQSSKTHGLTATSYVYDASGNTIAKTNGAGTTCSQYDSENRLTSIQTPGDSQATSYTYDPNGAQLTATNGGASYLGEFGHLSNNSGSATKTITLTAAPGAGNAVFLRVANANYTPSSTAVSDSEGNSWTRIKQGTVGEANSLYGSLQNTAPLKSGDTITITYSGKVYAFAGVVDAFSGVTSLTPDQSAAASDSVGSTARNSGTTPTTSQASELQIAGWGVNAVETSFTPTTGATAFHTPYLTGGSASVEGEYKFVNTTGAYSLNASGGVSAKYNGFIVTLPAIAGGTTTSYYDEQGRPVDTTDSSGAEAAYSYDADGNQVSRIANKVALSGKTCPSSIDYCTTYSYDAADQLSSETAQTDPANQTNTTYSFFYDNRGNLRGTQYPNGTFSWVDTNPDGWITDQYNRHGTINANTTQATVPSDSSPLAGYSYTYDPDGKRLSEVRQSGSTSQTTTYSYDNLGRLNQVSLPSGTCRNYGYDLDSNRSQIQESTTGCSGTFSTTATYTYNPSTTPGVDELTNIGSTNYTYTSDGQTSSQGTTTYSWDGFGRLKTATIGSNTITYGYDPTGALKTRASSSPSSTLNYLLGDLFETNASGSITTSYTDGPAGDLASYNGPPTNTSTPTYQYYDAHGNLAAEANTSGTITANHTYDPFGAPTDSVPSNTTIHRYTGRWNKQYDTTTNLILMGARPYDPTTGRFLSVDPVPGGSLNNYDYAGQDPINNYDLTGDRLGEGAPSRVFLCSIAVAAACTAGKVEYRGVSDDPAYFKSVRERTAQVEEGNRAYAQDQARAAEVRDADETRVRFALRGGTGTTRTVEDWFVADAYGRD